MLHRYLGLAVGLVIVVIGLTGSLLVFAPELDRYLIHTQFGNITPQPQMVSVVSVAAIVKDTKLGWTLGGIDLPITSDDVFRVSLDAPNQPSLEVLVNPYTAQILGERVYDRNLIAFILALHYTLLAGEVGTATAGVAALLLFILSISGILLWPGWRNLIAGFKIKWNGHIKRLNFDIHKVAGIATATFLAILGFTGFAWNFYSQVEPLIYAATLTPVPTEPTSKVIQGSTISLAEALQRANAIFPDAKLTYLHFPTAADGIFQTNWQLPGEQNLYRSRIFIDRYTGEVLKVRDSRSLPLADQVLDSFTPLHYGTFGGLCSRILYVFVGLAPLILFVTGLIMWWHRRTTKNFR
jgi:uncharacterized iron-regulated membrane protein